MDPGTVVIHKAYSGFTWENLVVTEWADTKMRPCRFLRDTGDFSFLSGVDFRSAGGAGAPSGTTGRNLWRWPSFLFEVLLEHLCGLVSCFFAQRVDDLGLRDRAPCVVVDIKTQGVNPRAPIACEANNGIALGDFCRAK